MSSIDWVPELASALEELVPLGDSSHADWADVVGRVSRRRRLLLGRRLPNRRVRLVLVVALLFLLLTGVATATYLLLRGTRGLTFVGSGGRLVLVNQNGRLRTIASCAPHSRNCTTLEPAWSPDGTRVAFLRGRYFGHMFVYVAAADAGPRRLAPCGLCGDQFQGQHLGWSPDGSWIAFSRDPGPTAAESLWVVAAPGGKPHRLTDCHASCADIEPTWSPNGRLLAFQQIGPTRHASGLYTIRPDGSGLNKIATDGRDPRWSPNGHQIVFDDGPDSLAVVNADGSHMHVLIAGARGTGPGLPAWSPDSRKLVFFWTPGRPGHYRAEVWTVNADGSEKKRLYHSGCCLAYWTAPIWSPNGRVIAFAANTSGGTYVINADGTGLRRVSRSVPDELSWQPAPKRRRGTK